MRERRAWYCIHNEEALAKSMVLHLALRGHSASGIVIVRLGTAAIVDGSVCPLLCNWLPFARCGGGIQHPLHLSAL